MAACVINISTDISMIFGTIKRKHYFLLPWLSVFGFWICLLILQTAVLTCLKIYVLCTGKLGEAGNVGTTLLLLVIIGSFYIYLWVCVKSLYIRVKTLNNPPTWNEKVLEPVK
uniref:Uncharacterized protein n=1 Tax=Megaselia scalaris TaxID=36166 RepID=T1H315_MEGSC